MPSLFAQAMNPANAIRPAPAPHSYGRPATEADVQAAQFQNYLKAPAPVQKLMQHYSPDSDGYARIQNAQASAAADLAARPGVRQIGTDGQVHDFEHAPATQNELATETLSRVGALEMLNPAMGQGLSAPGGAPAPRQHIPQRQARNPIGMGEINGVQQTVPTAGNYVGGEYKSALEALNPAFGREAMYGISMDRVNGAREAQQYLAAGLPLPERLRHLNPNLGLSSDIQQKQDLRAQQKAQKAEDFQLKLAESNHPTIGPNAPKSGLEMRRDLMKEFLGQKNAWRADQTAADKLEGAIAASIRANTGKIGPDGTAQDPLGFKVTVGYQGGKPEIITIGEAKARVDALRRPEPTREQFAADLGVDPGWLDLNEMGGPVSAAGPLGAPKPGKPKQTDRAELDGIPVGKLDAAIAIARQKNPADVPYLQQRKRQAQAKANPQSGMAAR